jgi:hypothetical protein
MEQTRAPRLLTARSVFHEYGLPPDVVRRYIRLGIIPAVRLGRSVFIDREAFETFLREGGRGQRVNGGAGRVAAR